MPRFAHWFTRRNKQWHMDRFGGCPLCVTSSELVDYTVLRCASILASPRVSHSGSQSCEGTDSFKLGFWMEHGGTVESKFCERVETRGYSLSVPGVDVADATKCKHEKSLVMAKSQGMLQTVKRGRSRRYLGRARAASPHPPGVHSQISRRAPSNPGVHGEFRRRRWRTRTHQKIQALSVHLKILRKTHREARGGKNYLRHKCLTWQQPNATKLKLPV